MDKAKLVVNSKLLDTFAVFSWPCLGIRRVLSSRTLSVFDTSEVFLKDNSHLGLLSRMFSHNFPLGVPWAGCQWCMGTAGVRHSAVLMCTHFTAS